jgi:hypothetical protein
LYGGFLQHLAGGVGDGPLQRSSHDGLRHRATGCPKGQKEACQAGQHVTVDHEAAWEVGNPAE